VRPRVTGSFQRDAAAATKFWRAGTDLLAKLPTKPKRNAEQQIAAGLILLDCRDLREQFPTRHADAVYRKLTKNLGAFVRVEQLAYDAAKLVPGLTPTRRQVEAESALMQSEKDGVEIDQGIFFAQVLAVPNPTSRCSIPPAKSACCAAARSITPTMPGARSSPPASISPISIAAKSPISGTSAATWASSKRCCAAWQSVASAPRRSMAARARSHESPGSMASPSVAAANICW
jgi:hypothetical protein